VQKEILIQNLEREKALLALTAKLGTLTERNRALFEEALDNYAARLAEDTVGNDITFEEIGVDLLLVDEAQNFKNIWPMGAVEGGTPKYLGAIQAGSARGIQLAAYRHNISRRIGAVGGTYLLSATPAKNSPIEYFTLIGLVNERAWVDVGVPTVEAFVDRYLTVERRDVVQPDMSIKEQAVVAGFQNLIELRDVIFRFAEFKSAADVGLVLPESKTETVLVDMSGEQAQIYYQLAASYRETVKSLGHAEGAKAAKLKNAALSLLTRMQ
jgi:N12 class adenine-specific DNA methylase